MSGSGDPFALPPADSESTPPNFWLESPPPAKGRPLLAWIVILTIVVLIVIQQNAPQVDPGAVHEDGTALLLTEIQGKNAVGTAELVRPLNQEGFDQQLYDGIQSLNVGTVGQRLRFIVLAGELDSPREALTELERLRRKIDERKIELTEEQEAVFDLLTRLYGDYAEKKFDAPSLSPEDRQLLVEQLDWFGQLALAPRQGPDPAQRSAAVAPARRLSLVYYGSLTGVGLLGLLGLAGLIVLLILYSGGRLRGGLPPGSGAGNLYAETFAVWLIVFLILSGVGASIMPEEMRLLGLMLGMFASLAALLWPVWRGASWNQVCRDIGWTAGRSLFEPLYGVACYAMTLPMMAIGVILTLILLVLQSVLFGNADPDSFNPTSLPAHPIVEMIQGGGWWGRVQILLVAAVAAPIVEETMFRGILYRHLRDATWGWGALASVPVSAVIVAFIFAVIHPQGLAAVPALMAIAFGLTLAREWRDSLIAAIVTHGINNGLLLVLLMLALG